MWSAEGGGDFYVETEVTGSADWLMSNPNPDDLLSIKIDYCLHDLSGNVTIKAGRFDLQKNFCTTGNINWDSTAEVSFFHGTGKAGFGASSCSLSWCP